MSTIAERAREEAERVEAEEAEENEQADQDAEPDAEPGDHEAAARAVAQAASEVDLEKRFKQLDNEHARHEKRLREILGDDFDTLLQCPMCWTDGYALQVPVDQRPPEQVAAIYAVLGQAAEPEYAASPRHVTCNTCDGWGVVLSGARAQATRTVNCPTCGALGYIDKEGQIVTPPSGGPPVVASAGKDPLQEQLEARGFTVIPPYVPPAAA
jgi:rubrerythrin